MHSGAWRLAPAVAGTANSEDDPMAMTWVVCGTGRAVGKTRLARRLCRVLPRTVYAKLGHHPPKPRKPRNYFRSEGEISAFLDSAQGKYQHVVLEAHPAALRKRGDIVIFVDGIPLGSRVRKDAGELRTQADLRIGPGVSVRGWKGVLRRKLAPHALREAVCDALAESQRYLLSARLRVKSKIWFVAAGMHAFGSGLARLLDCVERHHSLADAARADGISYRCAWDLIRNAEAHIGRRIVVRRVGGAGGGRTVLSEHGRSLLEVYRRVSAEVSAYADKRFGLHFRGKGLGDVTH
jgi:molybdate transport system regulatory protein